MEKLIKIQTELFVPKEHTNSFGGYKYRSCEDILEAIKPLLEKYKCLLTVTDELELKGDRYYVHAKAVFIDGENKISVSGYAREAEKKKGMDESQITGAASSYARKYALNGLFLIDDTKDADTQDNRENIQYINEKQMSTIVDYLNSTESDVKKFCSAMGIRDLDSMTTAIYAKAIKALQKKAETLREKK